MSERKRFEITTEPLSLDDVAARVSDPSCGAIVPIWKQENWADGQVWVEGPRQPDLALDAEEFQPNPLQKFDS